MKPIITTQGKLAQLRYELPHRVHDAHVYPVRSPNGSTIVLYAHETGVGVLWRGGRPLKNTAMPPKQPAKPPVKVNGTSNDAIMIIDSDDDEPSAEPAPVPQAEYEDEEEELDPEQPYPSIIQHLRLSLNADVLHMAIPHIPTVSALRPTKTVPAIFSNKIVCTVACADYSIRVVTLPLSPPSDAAKEAPLSPQSQYGEEIFRIPSHAGHKSIPRGVSMTWTSRAEPTLVGQADDDMGVDEAVTGRKGSDKWDLLVASHSTEVGGLLNIWRLNVTETSVTAKSPISAYQSLTLRTPATKVAFSSAQYPKRRHSQLLITDNTGIARIYDPFALPSRKRSAGADPEPGAYVALFKSPFRASQNNTHTPPILAVRKPILDAVWASDGNSILALLADGQWGIWDVTRTGPDPPADPSTFSVQGYLGRRGEDEQTTGAPSPRKSRGQRSSLAPMTPNTRKYKEEKLFKGTPSGPTIPTRGGITIASLPSPTGGEPEDSAIIWYGADVYRIPNVAQFWSRSAAGSDGSSLSRAAISTIEGIDLLGEAITSIDQFDTTIKDARMARPRDALVSTDHRLIFLANAAAPLVRSLDPALGGQQDEGDEVRWTDQALLVRGELDLGGMDRLLEDMEGSGDLSHSLALGNPRRVLFASSTS